MWLCLNCASQHFKRLMFPLEDQELKSPTPPAHKAERPGSLWVTLAVPHIEVPVVEVGQNSFRFTKLLFHEQLLFACLFGESLSCSSRRPQRQYLPGDGLQLLTLLPLSP